MALTYERLLGGKGTLLAVDDSQVPPPNFTGTGTLGAVLKDSFGGKAWPTRDTLTKIPFMSKVPVLLQAREKGNADLAAGRMVFGEPCQAYSEQVWAVVFLPVKGVPTVWVRLDQLGGFDSDDGVGYIERRSRWMTLERYRHVFARTQLGMNKHNPRYHILLSEIKNVRHDNDNIEGQSIDDAEDSEDREVPHRANSWPYPKQVLSFDTRYLRQTLMSERAMKNASVEL